MSWGSRRKMLYAFVVGVLALALLIVVLWKFISHTPTCFDGIQNGAETGVDCGGSCVKICNNITQKPVVLWAKSFRTNSNTVTAAAYIQNANAGMHAGSYGVRYAFRLYDDNNLLIMERDGIINIPPQNTVPIVEPNIVVGDRVVEHTFFDFFSSELYWVKIPADSQPSTHVINQLLSTDGTHLSATIVNDGLSDIKNLTLIATLFDASGEAVASSKSLLSDVGAGGSHQVVFTWSKPSNPVRAEIITVPALL